MGFLSRQKFKHWLFGPRAKNLPVFRRGEDEKAVGCVSAKATHPGISARRHPSNAVPENLAAILADLNQFLVKNRREWDIHKISRLYAGEYYSIGESRELFFEDCWVHLPSGTVISSAKEVIAESTIALGCFYQGHSQVDWEDAPLIDDDCFLLATCWGSNYAHWLFDSLPRLSAHFGPESHPKLLLGKNPPPFQRQSLCMLGWSEEHLITPKLELVKCRRLCIHIASEVSGVPHSECVQNIRQRLLDAAGGGPSRKGSRRIYISRQKTRRKIVNYPDIEAILREFGFEEVFCEELSFEEQVRIFSEAEAIFGHHGAGTINAMFAPVGAVLIEAFNPQVWDHTAHRMASLFGIRHFHLFGKNANKEFDVILDPKILTRTLALALDSNKPRPELIEEKF
jgi:capsular polysaccharide biosynthesis protein